LIEIARPKLVLPFVAGEGARRKGFRGLCWFWPLAFAFVGFKWPKIFFQSWLAELPP
jgi:hypothetical protein